MYFVKSTRSDEYYEIDTNTWTCTCGVGITGFPSGEPCKHQHAVANKFKLISPDLVPFLNAKGRHLYAVVALGEAKAGTEAFYTHLCDQDRAAEDSMSIHVPENPPESSESGTPDIDDDHAINNLEQLSNILCEHDGLKDEVSKLCYNFVDDVCEHTKQMDTQYLLGLKKFFSVYLDTVSNTEPELSATPKLTTLLHTYIRLKQN